MNRASTQAATRGSAPAWRPGSLLSRLSPLDRARLRELGSFTRFARGDVLIHQDQVHPVVHVLMSGVVKVTRSARPDSRPALITPLLPGDVLCLADALHGRPAHLTCTATKTTTALTVPREAFTAFIEHHSETVVALLADEVRDRNARLAHAPLEAGPRLLALLEHQQAAHGVPTPEGVMLDLGLTQADLAAAIGAAPGTVGRELAALQERGVIGMGCCTIHIKSRLSPHSPEPER